MLKKHGHMAGGLTFTLKSSSKSEQDSDVLSVDD